MRHRHIIFIITHIDIWSCRVDFLENWSI